MNLCVSQPRLRIVLALLATGAALLVAGSGQPGAVASLPHRASGGTFKVSFVTNALDSVDPALSYTEEGWALLDATCARLLNYPDSPAPEGLRLVPEVAAGYPRVSKVAKTYPFRLRTGFRFSDGAPIRASAFARAINRILGPGITSGGAPYMQDIVGAGAVRAGRSEAATGVVADGNRLVVRFTRPVPDFPAQTTMPFFRAVPPTLPSDPEGIGAFPGSGPYYVSEYVRDRRAVLARNRFYRGARPHRVDRFVVDLQGGTPADAARLQGDARYRAYGQIDVQLARDAVPMVAVANDSEATLVSKRAGCIVLRPALDLTAACLR